MTASTDLAYQLIRATQEHIPLLVSSRLAFLEEIGQEVNHESREALREGLEAYFVKALPSGTCIAFLAECQGHVAATGMLVLREQPGNFKNPSGRIGYILNMHTLPAFRRKGLCTAILDALKSNARKAGVHAFELHSTPAGESVYLRNGFSLHPEPSYRINS